MGNQTPKDYVPMQFSTPAENKVPASEQKKEPAAAAEVKLDPRDLDLGGIKWHAKTCERCADILDSEEWKIRFTAENAGRYIPPTYVRIYFNGKQYRKIDYDQHEIQQFYKLRLSPGDTVQDRVRDMFPTYRIEKIDKLANSYAVYLVSV